MSISTIPLPTTRPATLDDLAKVDGKAELIDGRIVRQMPTGYEPNRAAFRIVRSLDDHAELTGHGVAFTDNMGFAIPEASLGTRVLFSGRFLLHRPSPDNPMRFVQGAPTFAVEVRSESDYGEAAEQSMAAKRADYFLAGTSVVWDVDLIARSVRKYRADSPHQSVTVWRRVRKPTPNRRCQAGVSLSTVCFRDKVPHDSPLGLSIMGQSRFRKPLCDELHRHLAQAALSWRSSRLGLLAFFNPPAAADPPQPAKKDCPAVLQAEKCRPHDVGQPAEAKPGETVTFKVTAKLDPGNHIYKYSKSKKRDQARSTRPSTSSIPRASRSKAIGQPPRNPKSTRTPTSPTWIPWNITKTR